MEKKPNFERFLNNLKKIRWPERILSYSNETEFNKIELCKIFQTSFEIDCIDTVDQLSVRKKDARPFFGWAATEKYTIHSMSKSDKVFKSCGINFVVENKIVKPKLEWYINTSFVEGVGYLNLYDIDLLVVLIFDYGRGKYSEWDDNENELKLINIFISNYPMWIVRVRQNYSTKVYYNKNRYRTDS